MLPWYYGTMITVYHGARYHGNMVDSTMVPQVHHTPNPSRNGNGRGCRDWAEGRASNSWDGRYQPNPRLLTAGKAVTDGV